MNGNDLKIALIMPPNITATHGFSSVKCSYAGLGLVYLASFLHKHGYEAQILDLSDCNFAMNSSLLNVGGFDVYGIAMYSESVLAVDILSSAIFKANPGAKIIVGGHHATHEWKSVLTEFPFIYAVVLGDGEVPMLNLIQSIAIQSFDRDSPGVAYKNEAGDHISHGLSVNKDLRVVELDLEWLNKDHICFPMIEYAKRLFPQHPKILEQYLRRNQYYPGCQAAGIITSRGCIGRCSFCTFEISKGYYKHSPKYVLDLLEWYAVNDISNLIFYDSTFLADLSHTETICRAIIENKYGFKWTAQTQVHHRDLSIIKLMAEAGLVQMNLGLESGSPAVLRDMNKYVNLNGFSEVINIYQRFDIGVCANLILGSPGENDHTIRETCQIFYRVSPDAMGEIQNLKLYPGSRWYVRALEEKRISNKWDWKSEGIPRFVFHDRTKIEKWQIILEAHSRYAAVFRKVASPIDNVMLCGFPENADIGLLVEAIGYAFPGVSIGITLLPGCANLIIRFGKGCFESMEFEPGYHDRQMSCHIEDDAFKLELIH